MLTNSQKEHLTYTAIGQVTILFVLGIWTYSYIVSGIDKINAATEVTNANIDTYQNTEANGLTLTDLDTIIGKRTEYTELLKIMKSDVDGTKEVLKKSPAAQNNTYLEWLKDAMGNDVTQDEKKVINQYKKKLNSILPTLSPVSGTIEEDNITLKEYVQFIETKILKKFNLESNLILGMQGITIGKEGTEIPENIGTFDLQISFKAKNKDITDFIQFLNITGNPELLTSTGVMTEKDIPGVMTNPLITIVNFGLQDPVEDQPTDKENSGRVTLRFYVRGVSATDMIALEENIKAREKVLSESLTQNIEECTKQGSLCGDTKTALSTLSQKFQEYKNGTSGIVSSPTADAASQVYMLAQRANTLRSLEDEFEKIVVFTKK
ncbi:MAG: hypothetical protein PHY14_03755 [Candidatus Gracilibacteria bacterium]|nr:hypothetical protein [Candidatus Gracilibacteria bacterium]